MSDFDKNDMSGPPAPWMRESVEFNALVNEMTEAWAFVMQSMDRLDEELLATIHIEPFRCVHDEGPITHWQVCVSASVDRDLDEP